MGIGAMCAVMLRLPLTSVLLATLLLYSDGLAVVPLVIVAVVAAYVTEAHLRPAPAAPPDTSKNPALAVPESAAGTAPVSR
jgi:hypothetical protein